MSGELPAYVPLVVVGFLPNEVWRRLGLVVARGIDEEFKFSWARAVATAVLAGVIAKIVMFPPGALAVVPLGVRLGAIFCGFVGIPSSCAARCSRVCSRASSCSSSARSLTGL